MHTHDFIVEHRKGSKNGHADGLSREPWCPEAANSFAAEEGGRNVRVWEPHPVDRDDLMSGMGPLREHILQRR